MAFVTPCEKLAVMQPDRTRVGLPVFGSVGDVSAEGFDLFPRVGAPVAHAAVVEGP